MNILQEHNWDFPKKIEVSDSAKDLLLKLLIKDQNERIREKGRFNEIKNMILLKVLILINY